MIHALGDRKVDIRGDDYFVAANATLVGSIVLHDEVGVWFNAVIRGDNDLITIGPGTNIQDGAVLHTDEGIPLDVGRGVTVGHMAMLHGCTIGDYSLIGIKSVILNNARIGRNCLVGANTLITEGKEIPDGSLVIGSPGQVKRQLTEEEIAGLRESADHYVRNFKRYKEQLGKQE